jgi:hypothetical protein
VRGDANWFDQEEEFSRYMKVPGVDPDTLWKMEAQYVDEHGEVLSTTRFEVAYVQGEWRSELAPLQISTGYLPLRDEGEFGDGPPDLSSAMKAAPSWITMRMTQRIVPLNLTEPITVPAGAKGLRARLVEVCPLKVRRMRQINWRPTGDVISFRHVREEMRWREYVVNGACRKF